MLDSVNNGEAIQLLNQKQTAAELGLSAPYLVKLRDKGVISYADPARKLYNPAQVRADIARSRDVGQTMAAETRAQGKQAGAVAAATPTTFPPLGDDAEPGYGTDHHENFKIARSQREQEEARIARVKRMEAEGAAVAKADVERETYTTARMLRDRLLGALPTKLAPKLALITDVFELEQVLREALRAEMLELVKVLEQQPADQVQEGEHAAG